MVCLIEIQILRNVSDSVSSYVSSGESELFSQIVWLVGQILILEGCRKSLIYMKESQKYISLNCLGEEQIKIYDWFHLKRISTNISRLGGRNAINRMQRN